MGSREDILNKLRAAPPPFTDLPPRQEYLHMAQVKDYSPTGLLARFKEYAERLSAKVHVVGLPESGITKIMHILDADKKVLAWDFDCIPLPGLREAFAENEIEVAPQRDDSVRVGITGAEAAIAGTGSLILISGAGKPRSVSLLPSVHIAVITSGQLVPDLETWMLHQRGKGLDQLHSHSNVAIISGTSRTADIAMELIMGVHGPGEVHIVVLP